MIDRAHLLARLTGRGVELTDSALALAVAFVDSLPHRALTGEALARMQAEREAGVVPPPVDPEAAALGSVLAAIVEEVERANRLHGRTFPGGWGLHARAVDRETRQRTQDACDAAQGSGGASFRDVAEEEVAEVYAEAPGSAEHVRELAQVAAVYVRGMLFADFFRRVRESMGSEVQGE